MKCAAIRHRMGLHCGLLRLLWSLGVHSFIGVCCVSVCLWSYVKQATSAYDCEPCLAKLRRLYLDRKHKIQKPKSQWLSDLFILSCLRRKSAVLAQRSWLTNLWTLLNSLEQKIRREQLRNSYFLAAFALWEVFRFNTQVAKAYELTPLFLLCFVSAPICPARPWTRRRFPCHSTCSGSNFCWCVFVPRDWRIKDPIRGACICRRVGN